MKKLKSELHYNKCVKMIVNIVKIQRWWKSIPGCRKCDSKRLAYNNICVYCYHDKYADICSACIKGEKHYF